MCGNIEHENVVKSGVVSYVKKNIYLLLILVSIYLCGFIIIIYIYSPSYRKVSKEFSSIYQINSAGENELIIVEWSLGVKYLNTLTNESQTLIPELGDSEKIIPYFCWTSKDHIICGSHQIIIADRRQYPFSIKKISTDHIEKLEDWYFFYMPSNKIAVIFEKSLSGEGVGRIFYADLKKEMDGKNNESLYFDQLTENSVAENKIIKNDYDDLFLIKNKLIWSRKDYFLSAENTFILKGRKLEIFDIKRKESFFLPDEITQKGEKVKMEDLKLYDSYFLSTFCAKGKNILIVPMQACNEENEFMTVWDTEERKEVFTFDITTNYLNKSRFLDIIASDSGKYMAVLFWRSKMGILSFFNLKEAVFDVWDIEKKEIVNTCVVPVKNPPSIGITWGKNDDTIIVWGRNKKDKGEIYVYNWEKN